MKRVNEIYMLSYWFVWNFVYASGFYFHVHVSVANHATDVAWHIENIFTCVILSTHHVKLFQVKVSFTAFCSVSVYVILFVFSEKDDLDFIVDVVVIIDPYLSKF